MVDHKFHIQNAIATDSLRNISSLAYFNQAPVVRKKGVEDLSLFDSLKIGL